jgi:hypothetical protein
MGESMMIAIDPATAAAHMDEAIIATSAGGEDRVEILIPFVVPPTLPIGAQPPHAVAELNALRDAAVGAMWSQGVSGRAEILPCRSVSGLVAAMGVPERVVLVGSPDRRLVRTLRRAGAEIITLPALTAPRRHRFRLRHRGAALNPARPAVRVRR